MLKRAISVGVVTVSMIAGITAASATLLHSHTLAIPSQSERIQWRSQPGHRWHGRHWKHYRPGYGPAIGGIAAGAIIGSVIANSRAEAANDAYCVQRYRSYDPASNTYLGYDGYRHPCP